MKLPNIKQQVLDQMNRGIAGPSFLIDIQQQKKEIDKYLRKTAIP